MLNSSLFTHHAGGKNITPELIEETIFRLKLDLILYKNVHLWGSELLGSAAFAQLITDAGTKDAMRQLYGDKEGGFKIEMFDGDYSSNRNPLVDLVERKFASGNKSQLDKAREADHANAIASASPAITTAVDEKKFRSDFNGSCGLLCQKIYDRIERQYPKVAAPLAMIKERIADGEDNLSRMYTLADSIPEGQEFSRSDVKVMLKFKYTILIAQGRTIAHSPNGPSSTMNDIFENVASAGIRRPKSDYKEIQNPNFTHFFYLIRVASLETIINVRNRLITRQLRTELSRAITKGDDAKSLKVAFDEVCHMLRAGIRGDIIAENDGRLKGAGTLPALGVLGAIMAQYYDISTGKKASIAFGCSVLALLMEIHNRTKSAPIYPTYNDLPELLKLARECNFYSYPKGDSML